MKANQRLRNRLGRAIVTLSMTLVVALGASAARAESKLTGYVAYELGADFNRCVVDAGNVLNRLNARGEMLGFHYSSAGYTDLDGETCHIQGIQRLPYYWRDSLLRGQFFVATFSHPMGSPISQAFSGSSINNGAHLGVARLDFKGGKDGKALGTNRAYNDNWNGKTADWNVTPNPNDTFIAMAGTPKFKIDENENHPGGISTLGWHLVVPLQKYEEGEWFGLDSGTQDNSNPYVKVYDLRDPRWPVLRSTFLTRINGKGTDNRAAAITKLSNDKFLLAVMKSRPNRVEFYVSTGTNLDAPDVFGAHNRLPDARFEHDHGWENMNFITDCSGELFLLGFKGGGSDYIDLYKIDFCENNFDFLGVHFHGYAVNAKQLGTKHMYCSDNSDTDQCDFKAAAGSYVDPNGRLIVYATGYDNDGGATSYVYGNGNPWFYNYESHGGYIRGMEFRERNGNDATGSACPTLSDAWVEFYQNANFNTYGEDAGKIYRIDYEERDARNGKNMDTNDFNDQVSSIRWCIPAGHSFKMYRDDWSGPYQYLNGTGTVRHISDLRGWNFSYGGGKTNDEITSYHFQKNYSDRNSWTGEYEYGY